MLLTESITDHLNRPLGPGATRWSRLAPLVDRELQRLAVSVLTQFAAMGRTQTIEPSELVNEFYVRLLRDGGRKWEGRDHFYAYAAAAMRAIVIDRHRAKRAAKRPPGEKGMGLADLGAANTPLERSVAPMVELRLALGRLAQFSARQANIVELRFFGGFELNEIAGMLEMSERTVRRDWIAARAFLYAELSGGGRA